MKTVGSLSRPLPVRRSRPRGPYRPSRRPSRAGLGLSRVRVAVSCREAKAWCIGLELLAGECTDFLCALARWSLCGFKLCFAPRLLFLLLFSSASVFVIFVFDSFTVVVGTF